MLNFKPIEISDKKLIDSYLKNSGYNTCDFSFSNLFSWSNRYNTTIAIIEDFLVIRFLTFEERKPAYAMPVGGERLSTILQILMQDAKEYSLEFLLVGVTSEMFSRIETAMPDVFSYTPLAAYGDYLYETERLISLSGKKYQSKRNHINKFKSEHPDFKFVPITAAIIPDCLYMLKQWCMENGCSEDRMLTCEMQAVRNALNHYEELELSGGAIVTEGKIVAFSFGQPISDDTFGVHAEKAQHSVNGAYAIINQQMAEHIGLKYRYLNREEDMGLDSLRKAKMSYHPAMILEKGEVQLADK
jgi:hypothetical protein